MPQKTLLMPADFRGYGCTDDHDAQTKSVQLAGAFLLTMSNLFFVPAIILGVRRGFLLEAFVYFFTMFFSTVSTISFLCLLHSALLFSYIFLFFCPYPRLSFCFIIFFCIRHYQSHDSFGVSMILKSLKRF